MIFIVQDRPSRESSYLGSPSLKRKRSPSLDVDAGASNVLADDGEPETTAHTTHEGECQTKEAKRLSVEDLPEPGFMDVGVGPGNLMTAAASTQTLPPTTPLASGDVAPGPKRRKLLPAAAKGAVKAGAWMAFGSALTIAGLYRLGADDL